MRLVAGRARPGRGPGLRHQRQRAVLPRRHRGHRAQSVHHRAQRRSAGSLTSPPQSAVSGRPLVSVSLALNYAVGGLRSRRVPPVEPGRARRRRPAGVGHRPPHVAHRRGCRRVSVPRPTPSPSSWRCCGSSIPLHTEVIAYVVTRTRVDDGGVLPADDLCGHPRERRGRPPRLGSAGGRRLRRRRNDQGIDRHRTGDGAALRRDLRCRLAARGAAATRRALCRAAGRAGACSRPCIGTRRVPAAPASRPACRRGTTC